MFRVPSISGLFKWRQFEPEVILLAVGWYMRFSLSYRDVEELLAERGLCADHVTVWRWVQPRKWNAVCVGDSNRPTTVGGWTRPTSGSRASGAICIVRWILPARPSTFSSLPSRTRPQQSASLPKRWDGRTIPCRALSTPTVTARTRLRSCGSKPKALWMKTVG